MKMSSPPRLFEDLTERRQLNAAGIFECQIWDLIAAHSTSLDVAQMRTALEEVLLLYYDTNGDGTAGSA